MALTKYCDYDEIRAALGVNNLELADAVLSLPVYEIGLVRELNKVSSSLPAAFSTAFAEQPATAPDTALVNAVRMFSVYTVAKQAGVSLPTFAPKDVGDGKATLSRFAGQPYAETMANVQVALADARAALVDALAAYQGVTTATTALPTFLAAVGRLVDPVTGS